MSMLYFVFFLITPLLAAITPNYKIALDKYAQAVNHSNQQRQYLENAVKVIAQEVHKAESEGAATDQEKELILDSESFDEFDFITKKGEGLFYPADVKLSFAGQAFLAYLATAQTTNVQSLEKRERIISYLQKNPDFKDKLIKIIEKLKRSEVFALELGLPLTEEEKQEQDDFFLNRSNLIIPDFITKRVIPQKFVTWFANYFSSNPNLFNFLNAIRQPLTHCLFPGAVCGFIGTLSDYERMSYHLAIRKAVRVWYDLPQAILNPVSFTTIGMLIMFESFMNLGVIYSAFTATKDYYKSFLKREQRLVGAQKLVDTAQKLDRLLAKHPEFSQDLLLKDTLHASLKTEEVTEEANDSARFVLDQFNNNRIQDTSFLNYWLWGSRILVNKMLVDNPEIVHKNILPPLAGIGEIDAYCTISNQFSRYSTPHFTNEFKISLDQFFHPNIKNPVLNDLNISLDDKKVVCVSGGNGSGKSAITRSVVGAIISAQTFNKSPALQANIPMFDKIAIFANLSDNLGVGSKFQVELGKLKKLQEYLEKNPQKKVLLMIDEPLTSTNTDMVGKVLFDLFTLFSKYQNLVIFCVSNTPSLKNLESAIHMGTRVEKNEDGTFKPTYLWKEGPQYISDVWYQFRKVFGSEFGHNKKSVSE